MKHTVRWRLTIAVALAVGVIAVTGALLAPEAVEHALTDDRLDAEIDREAESLGNVLVDGRELDTPELTALFGPEIVEVTNALGPTGALDRLRALRPDDRLLVAPFDGALGVIESDGRVRVEPASASSELGPVVTTRRLQDLALELGVATATVDPYELLSDSNITFEQFVADLDARFGTGIAEQLDASVFDGVPGFDLREFSIPRSVFDELQREFGTGGGGGAVELTGDARPTIDDVVFGTRAVGSVDVIVTASSDGILRSVHRVRAALWALVPLAMVLAGGVAWVLAGRALKPVRAITEQTGRIRSTTLHERVVVPASNDEIAGLAIEMNTMLDRVQHEDDRRRQFVADASHELRSPIATIRTQAETALAHPGSDELHELASGVLVEAERMGSLVDDLLALARHDEGLTPAGVPVDLDDIVLEEASRLRRVPVDVHAVSAGRVVGRTDELGRVVAHLLDNAARHADARVSVALSSHRDGVTLTVDDDGPGVPADQRSRVFERFVRLDEARQRDRGGAGLGLAVVANVVRAAGGTVRVDDGPLGGARFVVDLPASD